MDLCVGLSGLLLIGSCGFAVVMAKVMQNLFFVLYSDSDHPVITELFLAATRWGFFVPLIPGIPVLLAWSKGRIQSNGPILMASMHFITAIVMVIVATGMLWPLLTTTWGLSE